MDIPLAALSRARLEAETISIRLIRVLIDTSVLVRTKSNQEYFASSEIISRDMCINEYKGRGTIFR